jgi:hypothetical protein
MNKTQTLFIHQLLLLIDESLKLNRYLLETIQDGPMDKDAHAEAMETFDRIEQKFRRAKADPGQ